jgi:hypothetical protein
MNLSKIKLFYNLITKKSLKIVAIVIYLLIWLIFNKNVFIISLFTFLLIYFAFIIFKKNNLYLAMQILIMLVMVHTFLFTKYLPIKFHLNNYVVNYISIWKEIVLGLMIIYIIINKIKGRKKYKISFSDIKAWIYLNRGWYFTEKLILLFITLMLISLIISDSFFVALYGIRNYIIGFIVYFIASNMEIKEEQILKFIRNISIFIVILCLWGIFQVEILGSKFLFQYGYGRNGRLPVSYYLSGFGSMQRVVSTFASPNTFAIVIVIACLYFLISLILKQGNKLLDAFLFLTTIVTLTLTFSRSSWIALLLSSSILVFLLFYNTGFLLYIKKNYKKVISYILLISFILLAVNFSNLNIVKNVKKYINNTITLKDTSARGHITSLDKSINFIKENPLGIGVGKSGPKSVKFQDKLLNSESSYFIIGFDLGICGILIYLILVLSILKNLYISTKSNSFYIKNTSKLVFSIWIGILSAYMFLPYIHELEHIYLLYALTGMIRQKSLKNNNI